MLTIGSLFSGIGGLEMGLEMSGLGPVLFQVEKDEYCLKILEKHWPGVKRFKDVKEVTAETASRVDILCGGFPCQDVSAAGKGAGLGGSRSGLWYEFARIVGELRPEWVVVENVASGGNRWVDAVRGDLEREGYTTLPVPLSAADVGAPHLRRRVFIVGHQPVADSSGPGRQQKPRSTYGNEEKNEGRPEEQDHVLECDGQGNRAGQVPGDVANSHRESQRRPEEQTDSSGNRGKTRLVFEERGAGLDGRRAGEKMANPDVSPHNQGISQSNFGPVQGEFEEERDSNPWTVEPDVGRVAHGVPSRVDRLRCLGNAVVPQVAEVIGYLIQELYTYQMQKEVIEDNGHQENIERVKAKIGPSVIRFIKYVGEGNTFHADDLRDWVVEETKIAPASADRILRDLRQTGQINYRVINRRKSLYEVLKNKEEVVKLFKLTKSEKQGCEASRCKETEPLFGMDGKFWGRTRVNLCQRHAEQLEKFTEKNPEYQPPVMEVSTPLDASVEALLVKLDEEAKKILEMLEGWEITTQEELEDANNWLRAAKAKRDYIEAREKEITQPIQQSIKLIRERHKPAKQNWANVEFILKGKISKVKMLEEERNRKALAEAAEAHAAGDQTKTENALSKVTSVGDLKGTSTQGRWRFEIIDASQIPRAYLQVNESAIRAHVAKYTLEKQPPAIPGVKFIPDMKVTSRAAT